MASSNIQTKHFTLLGKKPTAVQDELYSKFPESRGFSDSALNPEVLEAVLVLALTFGDARERVYIFAPPAQEQWVLDVFNTTAEAIFDRAKTMPNASAIIVGYGILFQKIVIAGRVLQLPTEPPYWLAFGFRVSDPLPDWVRTRLIV